jgi:hypothetical protein
MNGELNLSDFMRLSEQPATEIQILINTEFRGAIGRILEVNDIYADAGRKGRTIVKEAVLNEVNDLCRFSKKLVVCLLQSPKTPGSGK